MYEVTDEGFGKVGSYKGLKVWGWSQTLVQIFMRVSDVEKLPRILSIHSKVWTIPIGAPVGLSFHCTP